MDYTNMKTIEIAPSRKNTHIRGNKIIGRLSDGSRTYVLDLPDNATVDPAERNAVKDAFSQAIFLCSKKWQCEELLSKVFGCEVHMTIIEGPAPWLKPRPNFDLNK